MSESIAFKEEKWILDKLKDRKVRIEDTLSLPEDRKLTIAFRDDIEDIKPILLEILLKSENDYGYDTDTVDGFDIVNIYYKTTDINKYINLYTDILKTPDEVMEYVDAIKDSDLKFPDSQSARTSVLSIILASYWVDDSMDPDKIANKVCILSNDDNDEIISRANNIIENIADNLDD